MPRTFKLGSSVRLETLLEAAAGGLRLELSTAQAAAMRRARRAVLDRCERGLAVYGVNTGFGDLATRRIPLEESRQLQLNLVRSHASGVGPPLSPAEARAILFLRANEMARAHSGVRPELVQALARLYDSGAVPVIPSRGSVGASGDLAPLAHLALLLIGEGEAWSREGRRLGGSAALKAAGLKPLSLDLKEGLSLVNGTQGMQAVGGLALAASLFVVEAADRAAAMSLEALKGTPEPYRPEIHALKPHRGQVETARRLWAQLRGSEIRESHRDHDPRVQDPYSLRCAPQVHGAVRDALAFARTTVETELDSCTDNPLVAGGQVLSGGNFHGQALAFAFDFAALALAAIGNISERRIFHLVSDPTAILPPFLTKRPGLESGWMIPQVAAAALASENKGLAHPASADTIPTSSNKEDHVSMGMGAALKLGHVARNAARIVAIELLAGAQAVELHRPLKPGLGVRDTLARVRGLARRAEGDEPLGGRIETVAEAVLEGSFRG